MSVVNLIRSLGPIDVANVRRDSLLRWMIFLPILLALLLRRLLPVIAERLMAGLRFDLVPYYPLILGYFFVLLVPLMFGVVVGFLLLDERDDDTLTALQVTPMTLSAYLAYRIAVPVTLSMLLMILVMPLSGLSDLSLMELVLVALISAPLAPVFALFLASFSENKVQGFALMKGLGAVLIIPLVSFFVAPPWQYLFGIFPTYWAVKVYWMLDAGQSRVWPFALLGLGYAFLLLFLFLRRFNRVMHR